MKTINRILVVLLLINVSCGPKWEEKASGDLVTISNEGGSTLQYHKESGVAILEVDRFAFKDLNKNGELDSYEDWRLTANERALDLASKMTIDQIAGLMLYSQHQAIPASEQGYFAGTYGEKSFKESGASPSDLTDQQKIFLVDNNLRHVLMTSFESPEIAAEWNNKAQALVEGIGLGIPINTSSDPRHRSRADAEFNAGAGGDISMWPGTLGIAATFDPALMKQFGEIASKEYRALGIATALSPQIDLATEPRWSRFDGTMGEDPDLAADLAKAYVDGFQSTDGGDWGMQSVNAMVKHWPGGGPGEVTKEERRLELPSRLSGRHLELATTGRPHRRRARTGYPARWSCRTCRASWSGAKRIRSLLSMHRPPPGSHRSPHSSRARTRSGSRASR